MSTTLTTRHADVADPAHHGRLPRLAPGLVAVVAIAAAGAARRCSSAGAWCLGVVVGAPLHRRR